MDEQDTLDTDRKHPNEQKSIDPRRLLAALQNVGLVLVFSLFIYAHGKNVADGGWVSIPFVVEQIVMVTLVLVRRRTIVTSNRPMDWAVAAVGTWLPLAIRPADGPTVVADVGFALQLVGVALATMSFVSLGRSFGIVAANRGLTTAGPYGVVRHPIYLGHLLTLTGVLMASPSYLNGAILVVAVIAMFLRIRAEERVLTDSGSYAEYRKAVPWRLLPHVY